MKATSRGLALPPLPAVLIAIGSVQGGAALAKGLFPALGPAGTVGLRIGLSAAILLLAFRPPLAKLSEGGAGRRGDRSDHALDQRAEPSERVGHE
jgi:threonine/homoserine efflux transporter RhtA